MNEETSCLVPICDGVLCDLLPSNFTHDARMGPKEVRSTVLTPEQEAACVAFRKHTLLPLDDCLYALQSSIPTLTRSSLHRLF